MLRSRKLDNGNREVDLPVDTLGRERWRAKLDSSVVTRAADNSGDIGFKGHAAMFGKRTWIGPKKFGFWEQVGESAFTKTISEADVRFLINHDPNLLLARNKAGTMILAEDKKGLLVEADMAPVSYAQDVAVLLDRGDISQMSFAFEVMKDTWETLDDGNELRTLNEVKLWDVSVVTYPAYEDTDAGLRGAAFELFCRSAGLDDDSQARLLRGLVNPDGQDLRPILRAAGSALLDLGNHSDQPAETTDADPTIQVRDRFAALVRRQVDSLERKIA